MTTTAVRCSFSPCAKKTTDPSGRCHYHRAPAGSASSTALAPGEPAPFPKTSKSSNGWRTETWFIAKDVQHRLDGPAEIEYDSQGRVTAERWYANGKTHRVGAPAITEYTSDGKVRNESWCDRGMLSRIDGPAFSSYVPGYQRTGFYLYGKPYDDHAAIGAELLTHTDHALAREISRSPYAPLLDAGVEPRAVAVAIEAGVSTPEGVAAYLDGAPAEWARAFEDGRA